MSTYEMWVIRRRKFGGSVWHYGVLLTNELVAELREEGLRFVSSDGFAEGQDVEFVRPVPASEHFNVQQRLAYLRRNPQPYHLTTWNCETFANWLAGDAKPKSEQVRSTVLTAAVFGIAWALTKA